jgi:MFS family permease
MLVYKIDRLNAAGSVSLLLLGWAVSAPCVGWISDHIRRRKAPALICTSLALISFSILIYGPELSLTVARSLIFLNGLFSAGMVLCFATTREHNKSQAVEVLLRLLICGLWLLVLFCNPLLAGFWTYIGTEY